MSKNHSTSDLHCISTKKFTGKENTALLARKRTLHSSNSAYSVTSSCRSSSCFVRSIQRALYFCSSFAAWKKLQKIITDGTKDGDSSDAENHCFGMGGVCCATAATKQILDIAE